MINAFAVNSIATQPAFACIFGGLLIAFAISDFHRMLLENELNLLPRGPVRVMIIIGRWLATITT